MTEITPAELYDILYAYYGELGWWPAKTPYEMMVGAILTQNTAWRNVERALANFNQQHPLTPQFVETVSMDTLMQIIMPAGFFNQKAQYIKELTAWFKLYDYCAENLKSIPMEILRRELLAIRGVGEETADSILLYALDKPSFVIDAYTKRILSRLSVDVVLKYKHMQQWFESQLPQAVSLYNNFHACIVNVCKEFCTVNPQCSGCPLLKICRHNLS